MKGNNINKSHEPAWKRLLAPIARRMPAAIEGLRYYKRYRRIPDFRYPKDIYEVFVKLSLDESNMKEYARLADKYAVREFVKERIGEEYLTALIGRWKSADEVPFDKLPERFVLKTTNGCGTNLLVKDKSRLDVEQARATLDGWLAKEFGVFTGEPHYLLIEPAIIAEGFLEDDNNKGKSLTDYKFYCVHGKPYYMLSCYDRKIDPNKHFHTYRPMIYDMDWQPHPEFILSKHQATEIPRPASFDLMKDLAAKLSEGFGFVRVDFYEIDGHPVFGEMTFTPGIDYENHAFACRLGDIYNSKKG